MSEPEKTVTAFADCRQLARGTPATVAAQVRSALEAKPDARILVLDDLSGAAVDLDLRSVAADPAQSDLAAPSARKAGRPRLGVASREVTLLPRHWEWLAAQPGGASVTLRRLVEAARRDPEQIRRAARDAAYRAMSALAGDLAGFEEASRALFADDRTALIGQMSDWPSDVTAYLLSLLDRS